MPRAPVVGVMGGADVPEDVEDQARRLGQAIAERGWTLLNGGRDAGVMRASACGARQADGLVVGVLPGRGDGPGVADDLDVAVFTGMGEARNNVNVLSSDVVVALPGGSGTLSEAALAVKTGTPLVLLDWSPDTVPSTLESQARQVGTVEEALAAVEDVLESQ